MEKLVIALPKVVGSEPPPAPIDTSRRELVVSLPPGVTVPLEPGPRTEIGNLSNAGPNSPDDRHDGGRLTDRRQERLATRDQKLAGKR